MASSTRRIYKEGKEPECSETRLRDRMMSGNIQWFLTIWEDLLPLKVEMPQDLKVEVFVEIYNNQKDQKNREI